MPKEGAMTKISRPFQIALVAVVLLAAVYFVALRKHSSSSESSAPALTPTVAASAPSSSASSASSAGTSASSSSSASPSGGSSGSGTSTYKGSAPGVDGLTRAIQKARGAVTESEQNAKALQQKAGAASASPESLGSSATGTAGSAAATGGTAAAKHSAAQTHAESSVAAAVKAKSKTPAPKTTSTKAASGVPVMQARVEGELKHGKVAALLFWNPHGTVDGVVRRELQSAAHKLHGKLAISVARSSQVGSFGSFTRTVQVFGTPTILLVNPAGKTASVTGLTDVFSIEQAVREIKQTK
jgi:hypothetical protein